MSEPTPRKRVTRKKPPQDRDAALTAVLQEISNRLGTLQGNQDIQVRVLQSLMDDPDTDADTLVQRELGRLRQEMENKLDLMEDRIIKRCREMAIDIAHTEVQALAEQLPKSGLSPGAQATISDGLAKFFSIFATVIFPLLAMAAIRWLFGDAVPLDFPGLERWT